MYIDHLYHITIYILLYSWYVYGLCENMNIWIDNVGADWCNPKRPSSAGLIGEGFFSARATHYRERLQAKRRWLTGGGVAEWVDLDLGYLRIPEVWPETQQIKTSRSWKVLERSCGRSFQAPQPWPASRGAQSLAQRGRSSWVFPQAWEKQTLKVL